MDNTENTGAVPEVDEVLKEAESQETSAEAEDTSKTAQEQPEKESETGNDEAADGDKVKKGKDETYEQKLERLAQSKKDKELKPLYQKLADAEKTIHDLTLKTSEKTWDKNLNDLFNEEKESLGEDEAALKKAAREEVKKQVLDYQSKKPLLAKLGKDDGAIDSILNTTKASTVEEAIDKLSTVQRNQMAFTDCFKLVFPDDAKKVEQVEALVKKFEKARNMEDYEIIMEGIKENHNAKNPKFTPDSGRVGGSGSSINTSDPDALLDTGFKKLKNKK